MCRCRETREVVLNIIAVDGNAFLDNGKWQVQANVPGLITILFCISLIAKEVTNLLGIPWWLND